MRTLAVIKHSVRGEKKTTVIKFADIEIIDTNDECGSMADIHMKNGRVLSTRYGEDDINGLMAEWDAFNDGRDHQG